MNLLKNIVTFLFFISLFIILMKLSTQVLLKIIPFPSFTTSILKNHFLLLKESAYLIVWASWSIIIICGVIFILKSYASNRKKESIKNCQPLKDTEQANKVLSVLENKCYGKKALMINGLWGSGKTEFYRASLKPIISNKFPNKKIIETSGFGINIVDDLIDQIINKGANFDLIQLAFENLKLKLSGNTRFKKWLIPYNSIIVIDDFERVYDKSISSILGLFNYLIFEKRCFVIILCDESWIRKRIGNEEFFLYQDFSEKILIRYNLEITVDRIKKIINSDLFLEGLDISNFKIWLQPFILQMLEKTKNFRAAHHSLIDILDILNTLYLMLNEPSIINLNIEHKYVEQYLSSYFKLIFYAVFIKNNNKSEGFVEYVELLRKTDERTLNELDDHLLNIRSDINLIIPRNDALLIMHDDDLMPYIRNKNGIDCSLYIFIVEDIIKLQIEEKIIENKTLDQLTLHFIAYFDFCNQKHQARESSYDIRGYLYILFEVFCLKNNYLLSDNNKVIINKLKAQINIDKIIYSIENNLNNKTSMSKAIHFIDSSGVHLANLLSNLKDRTLKDSAATD